MRPESWLRILAPPLIGLASYAIFYILSYFSEETFSWIALGIYLLEIWVTWESCFRVGEWLDRRYGWDQKLGKRLFVHLGVCSLVSVLLMNIIYVITKSMFIHFWEQNDRISMVHITLVTASAILHSALAVAVQLTIKFIRKWQEALVEAEHNRRARIQAQLQALKQQINPHFLFNNFNTLTALIDENQTMAGSFVRELANIYRYMLVNRDTEAVALGEELAFLESYMFLLKTRHEDALSFEVHVNEAHKKRFIPPLSLQMLIENAIKHNIVDRAHHLKIEIGAQDGVLVVANNRHPRKAPPDSHGMGLSMLRKRYLYLTEGEIEVISDSTRFAVNAPLLETQL